jgi:uncharacterized membrane protein YbhN (UPF0104 family)
MTAVALAPAPALDAHAESLRAGRRAGVTAVVRPAASTIAAAVALIVAWTHRHQLGAGLHLLNHLSWWWLPAAVVFEAASLASFALVQQRLLRAGDINISAIDMTKISIAANAISASLPGGAAWSAPWSWRQLRRHGADRRLATWVVLAAGALSSFAIFIIVVAGTELAGDHGPVASLRWLARALAAIVAAAGLLMLATRGRRRRRSLSGSRLAHWYDRIRVVRLSATAWAASLILALANWLFDMACLIACIAAVSSHIDWRTVVIVYALTQIIAVLPFTPGGLGVVEAGLTALLVSYGTPAPSAIATVVVYRALTFGALVPAGWVVWWRLDKQHPSLAALRPPPAERTLRGSASAGRASAAFKFRPALRPHVEFNTEPVTGPAPGTPNHTPMGRLITQGG